HDALPISVRGDVLEEAPCLVLLYVEPGERREPPPVVAGLDDARIEPQLEVAVHADELDFLDVVAELVQPPQPLVDLEPLVRGEHLLARQLAPERVIPPTNLGRGQTGVDPGRKAAQLGLDVVELAGDVLLRDHEVVPALAVGERRVQLAGLRVDEVRGELAGVAAEERIRKRAVTPEEAAEVEPDE